MEVVPKDYGLFNVKISIEPQNAHSIWHETEKERIARQKAGTSPVFDRTHGSSN
jgi:hypothetical protein